MKSLELKSGTVEIHQITFNNGRAWTSVNVRGADGFTGFIVRSAGGARLEHEGFSISVPTADLPPPGSTAVVTFEIWQTFFLEKAKLLFKEKRNA